MHSAIIADCTAFLDLLLYLSSGLERSKVARTAGNPGKQLARALSRGDTLACTFRQLIHLLQSTTIQRQGKLARLAANPTGYPCHRVKTHAEYITRNIPPRMLLTIFCVCHIYGVKITLLLRAHTHQSLRERCHRISINHVASKQIKNILRSIPPLRIVIHYLVRLSPSILLNILCRSISLLSCSLAKLVLLILIHHTPYLIRHIHQIIDIKVVSEVPSGKNSNIRCFSLHTAKHTLVFSHHFLGITLGSRLHLSISLLIKLICYLPRLLRRIAIAKHLSDLCRLLLAPLISKILPCLLCADSHGAQRI